MNFEWRTVIRRQLRNATVQKVHRLQGLTGSHHYVFSVDDKRAEVRLQVAVDTRPLTDVHADIAMISMLRIRFRAALRIEALLRP